MTGSAASALAVTARLVRDLRCARGEAGTLWEAWADPAAVGYLRHMAGLPDPEEDPAAPRFAWHADGERLVLDQPLLGVTVRGVDAVALAEGIEDLGTFLSTVTPAAVAEAERTGAAMEALLPRLLARAVAAGVADWAPGVSYGLAEDLAEARPRPLDAARLRQSQATLEVQDHRNVIPIRPLPGPS